MPDPLITLRRTLFLVSAPMVFIAFALPLQARDLGASGFEIGILYSVFMAVMLLLRPLVGVGLDRVGRRPFLLVALLLYALASGAYALGGSVEWLYVGRLLHGAGLACLLITASTIVADRTTADERGAAMGGNIESQGRGGMVGAVIGFTLVGIAPTIAWEGAFSIYALIGVAALFVAARSLPETLIVRTDQRAPALPWPRELRALLVVVFLTAFASNLVQPVYLIYVQERFGLELRVLAAVFLPVGIVYAVLPSRLGRWTRHLPRGWAMALGLMPAGLLYALVPTAPGLVLIVSCFIGAAIGSVLADLTRNAWVGDLVPAHASGRAFGVVEMAAGIGATLGPLVGGALYDHLAPASVFYVNATVMVLAALIVLRQASTASIGSRE